MSATDPALRWQRRFVLVVVGLVVLPSLALTAFGLLAVQKEREISLRRVKELYEPTVDKLAEAVNQAIDDMLVESDRALDRLEAWALRRKPGPGKEFVEFCREYQAAAPFALGEQGELLVPRDTVPLPTWQGFMPEGFDELQEMELGKGKASEAAEGYARLFEGLSAGHPARCPLLAALARAVDRAGDTRQAIGLHMEVARECTNFTNHAGYNLGLGARLRTLELMERASHPELSAEATRLVSLLAFESANLRASFDQVAFVASETLDLLERANAADGATRQALALIANRKRANMLFSRLRDLAEETPRLLAVRVNGARYVVLLRRREAVTGLVLLPGGRLADAARKKLEQLDLAGTLDARLVPAEERCDEKCRSVLAGTAFLKKTDLAWRMQLQMKNAGSLEDLARSRSGLYLWLLALVVLLLGGGIAWTIAMMLREARLARLKTDFVSSVSHELRTPLTSIRMFTETLLLGRATSERERKECLEVIGQETERLSRLVERILDFSRMEKGRRAYRMEPCDMREVVEQAIAICRAQAEEAGMKIELSIQDELPEIRGDRDSLVEVMVNLLSNAVKYSPKGGRIGINVAAENDWMKIRVSDEGIGIPRSEQKKIFEKFYRVDTPRAAEVGGSGLGLSLVKYIVQAHGGTVEVDSAPGDGSTFTVTLPLAGPDDAEG